MTISLKPPTSQEVAARAGVSRTTVSFVLNNVRNKGISQATRDKVLAVARELGHEPHAAARILAGGATGTVALVIPRASHLYADVFLCQLVASINQECHQHGLKMLIESTDEEGRDPGAFLDLIRSRRIDGLIVVNPSLEGRQHLDRIADAGLPMVVFGAGLPDVERYHTCGNDTSAAAGLVVNHLVGLGHQKIAFVNFAKPEYLAVNERERGWREAMQLRGVEIDPRWVVNADITVESGYVATQQLLARNVAFTALFAGNDTIAFGAMRALREAGYSIPRDMAIVGYDDIPMAAYASPALTTIRTDTSGLGRDAMQLLMTLLQRSGGAERLSREKAVELVIRDSCGAKWKTGS